LRRSGDYLDRVGDAELLQRARRGDESAFSQLFTRYEGAVYRYATYMCGRDKADDIVQETFLAILQQHERDDPPKGAVAAYLIGIARHRIFKRAARAGRAEADNGEELLKACADTGHDTPLETVRRAERIAHVRAAVQSLPPVFREAIVLCELHEMDYAAAAAVVGCPVGTIRSRLHRGRSLLAAKLHGLRYDS
jgi:RNA polymerase sigma-70 factor, ECF subfamily